MTAIFIKDITFISNEMIFTEIRVKIVRLDFKSWQLIFIVKIA